MYTLYYLNRNLQIGTIKADTLDAPILIPEDLIFCDLRKGINFIKEPHVCIDFTDIERLIMQSEFNDINLVKQADYRMQNTYLTPLCQIDAPVLNPENYEFSPTVYKDEGALKLTILEAATTNLEAHFSLDGIEYTHVFDFDYWSSPDGVAELDSQIMFGVSEGRLHTSIYLDRNMRNEDYYNSVPDFQWVYFRNKITGKQSAPYDLSSFYL